MGFISDFGTGFAGLTLGLAALTGIAANASDTASTLDVNVSGLRSMKGNVLVCVTANPKYFPDCSKDPKSHRARVAARNAGSVKFGDLPEGTYALALLHDENANDKMDMAVFLPKEGFGFSRNPAVVTGPPKFKKAAFVMPDADTKQMVKMKYML
jgi:uncharacterized protein (DUF2141 family)